MLAAEAEAMMEAEAEPMLEAEAEADGEPMLEAEAEAEGEPMLEAEAEGESMLAAEGESMLEPDLESMLAADREGESMLAADGEDSPAWVKLEVAPKRNWCRFRDCVCPWKYFSATSRVAPGIDHVDIPDAEVADRRPAWSLLVGVTDGDSSLRLSRLRVARSGRILGRSYDALEAFHNIVPAKPPGSSFEAGAAPLPPDGRSLCVVHNNAYEQPNALQLTLQPQTDTKELPLPSIDVITDHCSIPISADGHIWALSATLRNDSFSVVTRRLVSKPDGWRQWELVGAPFTRPLINFRYPPWSGGFLQGYTVLPDTNLILVSFQQYGLFLTFAPDSGRWTEVLTDETRSCAYLPIIGRGIYVEQDKAIYMLSDNMIYAYKLTYQKDDQGMQQLKLDLPVEIDFVCPFISETGYGFLTRLTGCLLCSVWISLALHQSCPCDNLHAVVTTFYPHDPDEGGIRVLHSTFRRIDMVPNPAAKQKFCFLQEYEDQGSWLLQQCEEEQEDLTSSQHVDEPSITLSCCISSLEESPPITPRCCYQCGEYGHTSIHCSLDPEDPFWTIPIMGPSGSLQVDPDSSQDQLCSSSPFAPVKLATTAIKKDLFIICQAASRSVIYQTGAMDDDAKSLLPCVSDDCAHYWHFFQSGSKIHAVDSIRSGMVEFSLNKHWQRPVKQPLRRPTSDPFVMVIRVGQEIIAVTKTLQVYRQTHFSYGPRTWLHYKAGESDVVSRRVDIAGYVAVNDDSFIVCDAVTSSCLLFDLGAKQWRVVMPLAALEEGRPATIQTHCILNGRCVFVDGFIYTCRNGGIAAYELHAEDQSVYLSRPIILPFSQWVTFVREDTCLDYAGKDVDPSASLFYLVQGGDSLRITTVKVKTKRTASNKMKPVGIDLVGTVKRFTGHTETIDTRCCFAVSL